MSAITKQSITINTINKQFLTNKNEAVNATALSLNNKAHLPENESGNIFIPLCAKPSFLALLDQHPKLLEETINHTLETTTDEQSILIFIADGAVMEEAFMAMDRPARAHRITSSVAAQIQIKVDEALQNINNPRIKGVVHWDELVDNSTRFQKALESMEIIMKTSTPPTTDASDDDVDDDDELVIDVQYHIKTLVKNLFTQRVEKARKTGNNITNVFIGDGLEIRKGGKYIKRYNHLERACFLELCIILVGLDYQKETFTEMRYLTNDPQGMTYIAGCLEDLRNVFKKCNNSRNSNNKCHKFLIESATVSHGITFVEQQKQQSFVAGQSPNANIPKATAA